METVDEIATAMFQAVKQSEEVYISEQERARARDEQLRSVRQTNRSEFNYFTLATSTPIRNDNARSDPPGVHFNTNPIRHVYSTTSDGDDQYEPPIKDSVIQTATSAPTDQLATNTTGATGCNNPWRRNNGTNTSTATHRMSTGPTSRNGLHNNISPNSSDNRNSPICKTYNHNTKACRKQHNNIPSPANSQITTGYHPKAIPPPLMGTTPAAQPGHQQAHTTTTHYSKIYSITISQEPAP